MLPQIIIVTVFGRYRNVCMSLMSGWQNGALRHGNQGGQQWPRALPRPERWATSDTSERLLCCMDSSFHHPWQMNLSELKRDACRTFAVVCLYLALNAYVYIDGCHASTLQ